jgi:hypothetical protein
MSVDIQFYQVGNTLVVHGNLIIYANRVFGMLKMGLSLGSILSVLEIILVKIVLVRVLKEHFLFFQLGQVLHVVMLLVGGVILYVQFTNLVGEKIIIIVQGRCNLIARVIYVNDISGKIDF